MQGVNFLNISKSFDKSVVEDLCKGRDNKQKQELFIWPEPHRDNCWNVCDNTSGEAWMEFFTNLPSALYWLLNEDYNEHSDCDVDESTLGGYLSE